MIFLTDSVENQNQRVTMSLVMKACKVIEPSDWILNIHASGHFYRYVVRRSQPTGDIGALKMNKGLWT